MTKRNADRVEEFKQATKLERGAKKALLQELGRAAGREVNEQGGSEDQPRPRRGAISLIAPPRKGQPGRADSRQTRADRRARTTDRKTRRQIHAAHIAAVRRVLLQRFRRAARLMLRPITSFRKHHGGRRSNSGGKTKGKAFQLFRDEQRVARRFLAADSWREAEAGNASPAGGQNFCASAITTAPRSPVGRGSS
jgi:hypothetical protein